jgi:hypothetical protein
LTIPWVGREIQRAIAETENTRSYQGGVWLVDLDSNQD